MQTAFNIALAPLLNCFAIVLVSVTCAIILGRSMAQAVSRRLVTVKAGV